jgi:hypothetical protein
MIPSSLVANYINNSETPIWTLIKKHITVMLNLLMLEHTIASIGYSPHHNSRIDVLFCTPIWTLIKKYKKAHQFESYDEASIQWMQSYAQAT